MKEQIKNNKEQAITERQPQAAVSMYFYNVSTIYIGNTI